MIRILVFDANIVFAKKVAEILSEVVPTATVDVAGNVPVLRRRLREHFYNLVLADVLTAQNIDEAASVLVQFNGSATLVVFWTSVNPEAANRLLHGRKPGSGILEKPYARREMRDAVSPLVEMVEVKA